MSEHTIPVTTDRPVAWTDLLDKQQAAQWMVLTNGAFKKRVAAGQIVPLKFGEQTYRYSPAIIVAQKAQQAGVPLKVIAAALGVEIPKE